jgi:hypothetical protein
LGGPFLAGEGQLRGEHDELDRRDGEAAERPSAAVLEQMGDQARRSDRGSD